MNPLSKKIARKRSLDSLASNKEKNQKKIKLKEKVENSKMKECSFYPETNRNKKFEGIKSHYSQDLIAQSLNSVKENKERLIQQIRKQLEYEEMKECTFNPITKQLETVDYEEKLNQMRGVEKFMQQKEMSKQLMEQMKKREEDIFITKDYSQFRSSNKTVPQPFKLSKGNGPTQKKLREELLKECLEQCTFYPETNESQHNPLYLLQLTQLSFPKQKQGVDKENHGQFKFIRQLGI